MRSGQSCHIMGGYWDALENNTQISWLTMENNLSFHSGELSPTLENDIKSKSIYIIEVFIKTWIPNQENKYRVPDYGNDINDEIFDYKVYWKQLFKPNLYCKPRNRYVAIVFGKNLYLEGIIKGMRVGSTVDQSNKDKIISIIKNFWHYLKKGVKNTIIWCEFSMNIGKKYVCCNNASYGPYKSNIII